MTKKVNICDVSHWAYVAIIVIGIYYAASHYFLFIQYPIQAFLFQWGNFIGGVLWIALEVARFVGALYIFRWFLTW